MYTIYQVQSGDTLASVASKFGISTNNLSSLNGIMVGSVLTPGEYIVVPSKDNVYFREYMVKKGDTIYGIAREKGISASQLLRLNGLNETDIIYPNQVIMIPKDDTLFYITVNDDTLDDVINYFKVSADEIARNNKIYLVNDQLIVYRK